MWWARILYERMQYLLRDMGHEPDEAELRAIWNTLSRLDFYLSEDQIRAIGEAMAADVVGPVKRAQQAKKASTELRPKSRKVDYDKVIAQYRDEFKGSDKDTGSAAILAKRHGVDPVTIRRILKNER